MKKNGLVIAALFIMIMCFAATACAQVNFTNFTMQFRSTNWYGPIVSDTTSIAMVANTNYGRYGISSNTSSVNSLFRTGLATTTSPVSTVYYDRVTTKRLVYYNVNVVQGATVYLQGRPDSSLASCTITGYYGAG